MLSYKPTDKMIDLVKDNSALIMVMGRFGISLGFGEKTVREVCADHNVDEPTFLAVVNFVANKDFDARNISLAALMGYLKEAHEYYLKFNLPQIRRKLIEAIDCSEANDIAVLIVKFYDEYVMKVRRHMDHENRVVFTYVDQLLNGYLHRDYVIDNFSGKHVPIGSKLKELKDVIIRYYPDTNNYLLNSVLLDIMHCEEDLSSHCKIEDLLFVPAVKQIENKLLTASKATYTDALAPTDAEAKKSDLLSDREKDVLICVAKGMSNKEIADALFLSVHTVTTHRRNISAKLQIHTTAGLIIYAIANKLVDIQDIK